MANSVTMKQIEKLCKRRKFLRKNIDKLESARERNENGYLMFDYLSAPTHQKKMKELERIENEIRQSACISSSSS